MAQIFDVVAKTLAIFQPAMAPSERGFPIDPFFELYGFDILFDRDFTPWLLEVNTFPSLGFDEDVDYEVKGPLVAQALSIAGIPDVSRHELRTLASQLEEAEIDIDEVEAMLVRFEDERNVASGSGFIRVFPTEATAKFRSFLAVPRFFGMMQQRRTPLLDPEKHAKTLSPEQAMDILIAYLLLLQKRMDEELPTRKIHTRVANFLAAQGYQVTPRATNLKMVLRNYIEKQRIKYQLGQGREQRWPNGAKEQIMKSTDEFIVQLLLNASLTVRDIRTLFY
jgi:hypothetical protein